MKSLSFLSLVAAFVAASPFFDQQVLGPEDGFSLDLGALRLVQLEGQVPVWMTELDKVYLRLEPSILLSSSR